MPFPATPKAVHIRENDLEEVPSAHDNSRLVTNNSQLLDNKNSGKSQNQNA